MSKPTYNIQGDNLQFPDSADVAEMVLTQGLVIDAYRRGSLVGLEAGAVDGRAIVAGLDRYLELARAAQGLTGPRRPSGRSRRR